MSTRCVALAVSVVFMVACGGRQEAPVPQVRSMKARSITLPHPVAAVPAFRMKFGRAPSDSVLRQLRKLRGVAVIVTVRDKTLRVRSGDRSSRLEIGSVNPLKFRSVAPRPTRAADFVWTSLVQGEVVLTPAAASKLGVTGPATVQIGKAHIPIGAFADNAVPNLVDVLVADHAARGLRLPQAREVIVGTKRKAKLAAIRESLRRIAPGSKIAAVRKRTPPVVPEPIGSAQGSLIGTMTYRIKKNGFIEPDPAWVASNIVTASVPILGTVMCHRLLVPQLAAALNEIAQQGLADLIKPKEYGGCYVPRFIGRDSRRALSMHAFGLAIDLNVAENYQGTKGHMDPRVIQIFEKWGFRWGGYWSPPDPMHFELARLIQP